jgi:hypothetical protein
MAEKRPSFWTTIPGTLTGLAAIITAVAGLYLTLHRSTQRPQQNSPVPSLHVPTSMPPAEWPLIGSETFTEDSPGWYVGNITARNLTRADLRIVGGKYRWDMGFRKEGGRYVKAPYKSPVNFYVAVDVKMLDYEPIKGAGIYLGGIQNDVFLISSDKKFFFKPLYSKDQHWISGDIDVNPKDDNRLGALVNDSNIKLYINSKLVGEYRDDTFKGGRVGLVVTGGNGGSLVVDFDNYEFRRKPE